MIKGKDPLTPYNPPKELATKGIHKKVLEIFSTFPPGKVLDAPCGYGALAFYLNDMGFQVFALDLYKDGFKGKETPFIEADLNDNLPFEDNSFEYVACIEGIEHLENPYSLIEEISRVLKRGGRLILSFPNIMSIRSRIRFLFYSYFSFFRDIKEKSEDLHQSLNKHINPVWFPEINYILSRNRFEVERIEANRYVKKWRLIYPLIKWAIKHYTLRNNPYARTLLIRELLEGEVLIILARKK